MSNQQIIIYNAEGKPPPRGCCTNKGSIEARNAHFRFIIESLSKAGFTTEDMLPMMNSNWSNLVYRKSSDDSLIVEILPIVKATSNISHWVNLQGWKYLNQSNVESIRTMQVPTHKVNEYVIYDSSTHKVYKYS